jgi:hypothetical protein
MPVSGPQSPSTTVRLLVPQSIAVRLHAPTLAGLQDHFAGQHFGSQSPFSGRLPDVELADFAGQCSVWYPVQSINGTTVYVDAQATTAATLAKGYRGATGSTTFYMLQPTVVSIGTGNTVYDQVFSGNGSSGSRITISGGWNTTDMSTQDGLTLIDRSDWAASGINLTGTTGYITVDKLMFGHAAFPLGLVSTARGYTVNNSGFAGTGSFSTMPTRAVTVDASNFINCTGTTAILNIPATGNYKTDNLNWSITNTKVWGAAVAGIKVPLFVAAAPATVTGCDCSGNTGLGFDIQSICNFRSNTAEGNTLGGINFQAIQGQISYGLTARGNTVGEILLNNADVEIYGLDTNTVGGSVVPQISIPNNVSGRAVVYDWTQYTGGAPAAVLTKLGSPGTGRTAGNSVSSQKEAGVPLTTPPTPTTAPSPRPVWLVSLAPALPSSSLPIPTPCLVTL